MATAVDRDNARRSVTALLDDGDIKSTATQVVDQPGLALLQFADHRQGGRYWLGQQTKAV